MPPFLFDFSPILNLLFPLALVALVIWLWVRNAQKRRKEMTVRDRSGQGLPSAKGSFIHYAGADALTDRVMRGGMDRVAKQSLSVRILKPTVGLRFVSLLTTGLLVPGALLASSDMLPFGIELRLVIVALVLYAFLRVQTTELRYDDHEITTRTAFFTRVVIRWRDVARIEDAGQNEIVIWTEAGRKLRVLKHLVGMTDFVTYARQRIQENARELCPSFQKSKPFGVV